MTPLDDGGTHDTLPKFCVYFQRANFHRKGNHRFKLLDMVNYSKIQATARSPGIFPVISTRVIVYALLLGRAEAQYYNKDRIYLFGRYWSATVYRPELIPPDGEDMAVFLSCCVILIGVFSIIFLLHRARMGGGQ